ncbi:hypothetical protein [Paraburkholderia caledonica]|uniref:hypothetical protein n=1 Tax=Paraburkholderia caledonica TaxID=134536 RepID=UPI0038B98AAE
MQLNKKKIRKRKMKTLRVSFAAAAPDGRAAVTSLLLLAALQPLSAPDIRPSTKLESQSGEPATHRLLLLAPAHRESASVRLP